MSVHVCDVNEQALTQITDDNPAITATVCDVSNRASVESFVKEAVDTLGGIDVLINNAGISGPTKSVGHGPRSVGCGGRGSRIVRPART